MIVPVHMLAFQENVTRLVDVHDHWLHLADSRKKLLELVYYYGQNDVQPVNDCCSVSMGDVAVVEGKYFLCCPVGWRELSEEEFRAYKATNRLDRRYSQIMTENHQAL